MVARRFWVVLLFVALCMPAISANPAPGPGEIRSLDQWGVYDYLPPCPSEKLFCQPDGTSFEGTLRGMEIGGGVETLDGYAAVQDEDGWWTYSTSTVDGKPMPSSLRVGLDSPVGLQPFSGSHESVWLDDSGEDVRAPLFEEFRDRNLAAGPRAVQYVVLMVEFQATGPDDRFQAGHNATYFRNMLSGNGTNPTGTMTEYYTENSWGNFVPEFNVFGPYRVAGAHADYAPTDSTFMDLALDLADPTINFAAYDYDFVIFIHAGPDQSFTGNPNHIWSFATNLYYGTNDGVTIVSGCTGPEIDAAIGVYCHEMGHTIGCPDYYDTSYITHGTGEWDLMGSACWLGNPQQSNPGHLNPYSKYVTLAWATPTTISITTKGATLQPYELYPDFLRVTLGATEWFYFHYANKTCADFDRYLHGSGLVIWHYDGGGTQSNPNRMRLAVEEWDFLDGTQEIRLMRNRGEPTDPFKSDATGINSQTTPNTNRGTGAVSGWSFCNISAPGSTITLDLLLPGASLAELSATFPFHETTPPLIEETTTTISSYIINSGGLAANSVRVKFYDGNPASGGVQIGSNQTIATLGANARVKSSVSWLARPAASHNIYVLVDPDNTVAEASNYNNAEHSLIRVWPRNAPILLVDDDSNYELQLAYEAALTSLGYPYVMVQNSASLALMQRYEILIWFTGGNRQSGALNATEIANIKTYLAGGKCAWFLSHRLASALGSTSAQQPGVDPAFLRDYLGATYTSTVQAINSWANGTGDEIGGTNVFSIAEPLGRDFSDAMTVYTGATSSLDSSYGGQYGVKKIGASWRTVFFGFDLSQVAGVADRDLLTQRVLDWFRQSTIYMDHEGYAPEATVEITVHDTDLSGSVVATIKSGTEPAGEAVTCAQTGPGTFTGTITISETDSVGVLHVTVGDKLNATYSDASPAHVRYDLANVVAPSLSYFRIPVVAGWNLVSTPLIPASGALPGALADSGGDTLWNRAMWFDPLTPGDRWKQYNTGWPGAMNDLTAVDATRGVWLYVTSVGDGYLNITGTLPTSTGVQLRAGWNIIGYPARVDATYTVGQLKAATGATTVEGFSAGATYKTVVLADGFVMKRGQAYWVYVPSDVVWTVDW